MYNYKAAAIVFYRYKKIHSINKTVLQVYLQYEYKHDMWSHFGGKREPEDIDSFATAIRELKEESGIEITTTTYQKKYYLASKMDVYYIQMDGLIDANWFTVDSIPINTRKHVFEQIADIC
jgi:8-oxo-dGTP pyrophosphatase MutT (NUDIX family)